MAELIFDPLQSARLILMLRQQGITDSDVLGAIERVPRSAFVRPDLSDLACEDCVLPIECGQTIDRPSELAPVLQAMKLGDVAHARVLVVGAGSGYVMALLGALGAQVFGVERYAKLAQRAEENLQNQSVSPVHVKHGDGLEGWEEHGPYDRIVLMGAVKEVPETLLKQLTEGGFCLANLASDTGWELVCISANGARETCGNTSMQIALSLGVSKAL